MGVHPRPVLDRVSAAALAIAYILTLQWAALPARAAGDGGRNAGTCTLEGGPRRAVVRVLDSETLVLDDGSEVRLIGALAPRSPGADSDASTWRPEIEARVAMERLVAGRTIELAFGGQRTDRYGRQLAHVFTVIDGERIWVQGRMLADGHARAYAVPQNAACTAELLAHEAIGRSQRKSLWSNAAYRVRWAGRTGELMRLRGSFQIVEGLVMSASKVRGRMFLNFGSDWRSDFSVGISSTVLHAGGDLLAGLEGRRVRVRGWVERRNGPFIELAHHDLIEIIDGEAKQDPARTQSDAAANTAGSETELNSIERKRPAREVPGAVDL